MHPLSVTISGLAAERQTATRASPEPVASAGLERPNLDHRVIDVAIILDGAKLHERFNAGD